MLLKETVSMIIIRANRLGKSAAGKWERESAAQKGPGMSKGGGSD